MGKLEKSDFYNDNFDSKAELNNLINELSMNRAMNEKLTNNEGIFKKIVDKFTETLTDNELASIGIKQEQQSAVRSYLTDIVHYKPWISVSDDLRTISRDGIVYQLVEYEGLIVLHATKGTDKRTVQADLFSADTPIISGSTGIPSLSSQSVVHFTNKAIANNRKGI